MLAQEWLKNARNVMSEIEDSQMENIAEAARIMADSIGAGRWVHTFGCGHATIPVEEMYPRIGGFVGFRDGNGAKTTDLGSAVFAVSIAEISIA